MISFETASFLVIYSCAAVSAWLATYTVHSTLIIGGIALLTRVRAFGHVMQEMAWKVALTGGVVTATIALGSGLQPLTGRYETAALVEASWIVAPSASPLLRILPTLAVSLWIAYAVCVLGKVAYASVTARQALGHRLAASQTTCEMVAAVARTMGVSDRVKVTVSEHLVSPVVLGASEISLPGRMLEELTPEEQQSVICHELAHVARRDPRWLMVAATIESLFFFQLLNRKARMKWQEASEYVCDELAVRAIGSPLPLARALGRVAGWSRGDLRPLLAPAMTEQASTLLGRVQRLLADEPQPQVAPRATLLPVNAALALLVLVAAPAFAPGSVRGWGTPAFEWIEVLNPGQTIEIRGLMGSIHALPTDDAKVTVRATRRGRSTNPDIRFEVVRTERGATICVVYPTPPGANPNTCTPGDRRQLNTRANDVEVEFAVYVPSAVGLMASSATGNITTRRLNGPVSAYSASGRIDVSLAAAEWSGAHELVSLSGDVRVSLPRSADLEIAADTGTGSIKSDFALGQRHDSWWSRLKPRGSLGSSIRGVIGHGGRALLMSTTAGNITIVADPD